MCRRWIFGFSTMTSARSFTSATTSTAARLTTATTTCLLQKHALQACSPLRRVTFPQRHWLHLARPLTQTSRGSRALLSWSGTMFEYLMPPLLLGSYPGTLLYQTAEAAVEQQIDYGRQKRCPVGHFRIRLLCLRRGLQLPVPGLRRSWLGIQARPGGRPGGGTLCVAPGPAFPARRSDAEYREQCRI